MMSVVGELETLAQQRVVTLMELIKAQHDY